MSRSEANFATQAAAPPYASAGSAYSNFRRHRAGAVPLLICHHLALNWDRSRASWGRNFPTIRPGTPVRRTINRWACFEICLSGLDHLLVDAAKQRCASGSLASICTLSPKRMKPVLASPSSIISMPAARRCKRIQPPGSFRLKRSPNLLPFLPRLRVGKQSLGRIQKRSCRLLPHSDNFYWHHPVSSDGVASWCRQS